MKYIVFKCGHSYPHGTDKCSKCNEYEVLMIMSSKYECLKGRVAKSRKYPFKKPIRSDWSLPDFKYRPDEKNDLYM